MTLKKYLHAIFMQEKGKELSSGDGRGGPGYRKWHAQAFWWPLSRKGNWELLSRA